ncbi:Cof-type HAD-IIB family hydrolase [Bacillus sp. JJ1764]|uniref:Cof-type HAD-IIB family hydrolase n=1 Tax=Bacillus sp. JJ1764 TaxID=3122964 RepID=UPI003000DFC6
MKLIAIDLDGTLLSSNNEISTENIEALREAQNQGNIVMICSGRAPEDIQQIMQKYDFSCPLAGSNGTVIQADGKLLDSISMNKEDVIKVAEKLDDHRVPYRVYTNHGIYVPGDWTERISENKEKINVEGLTDDMYRRMTEQPQKSNLIKNFANYMDLFNESDLTVQKFFILTVNTDIKSKLASIFGRIPNIVTTTSGPWNLEVMDQDGNKGYALKKMAEYFSIPLEDTVAMGDNFNDAPMLQVAGLSIAMGNADPQVKEMSDRVTLSNDENGVAHAIETYIE